MSWSRKELKNRGRKNLRNNYWRIIGVVIIVSFVAGGFKFDINIGKDITDITMAIKHDTMKKNIEISSRFANKSSEEILNDMVKEDKNSNMYKVMGDLYKPTNGVLANLYNKIIGAESFLMGILNSTNQIFFKDRIGRGIMIMLGALIMLMLWIFIATPLIVGKARYMLEARSYYDTHIGRITFSWRVKRSKSTALIMASKQILWIFWCLTIVGGFIKHYSYKMIPYILAENPDINRKEAFELSKKMMYGQKWNAFKLDLSFIKWDILNVITLGTLKWLFLKPYKEATCTELYLVLREEIKAVSVENSYLLFDDYIGVEPGKGVYPWVNYPLSERVVSNWLRIQPKRKYSIFSLTMFFFTFSFIGWLWEVTIHIVEDGAFINRGTMFGPWLPIYGTGGILIIILLGKFVEKPWLTFILAVGVCGLLEYFTATLLWELVGVKWWDYSGYFFNIHGKVCAEGLIIFGIGGMAGIYILAPFLNNLYSRIAKERKIAICCILLILFSVDLVYSYFNPNMGEGITADIRFGFTNVGSIKEQSVQKLLIEK